MNKIIAIVLAVICCHASAGNMTNPPPVTSVAGRKGAVTLTSTDVGLSNVPNTDATNMGNAASGTLAVARGGTGVTASTGTTSVVLSGSPTITTPTISGNLTVNGGMTGSKTGDASTYYYQLGGTGLNQLSLYLGSGSVAAAGVNDFGANLRFNGATVAFGDIGYYPNANLTSGGIFRFSATGSTVNTTPNASVGVGNLYSAGTVLVNQLTDNLTDKIQVTGSIKATGGYSVASTLCSSTAPTISGFGTSPSVPSNNGTCAFTINVGTGGTASTGTVTLPAAATGWVCTAQDVTTPASYITSQTGGTTTTATFTNYSRTTGLATAWTASDILRVSCMGY